MKVALLTREYPPEVYGGAGVHVAHLATELARLVDIEVHCFGRPRSSDLVAAAYEPWDALAGGTGAPALEAVSVDLRMAQGVAGADLVHSHTWYANLGGHLAKLLHGIPHVVTAHSLEPRRPWKAQQLGPGYAVSSFCERAAIESADAVIAVSSGMRNDILGAYPAVDPGRVEVIPNGVDACEYAPDPGTEVLARLGIDPSRPSVVFVGRITPQKGILPLLDAVQWIDPASQLVLCASGADTPAIEAEVRDAVQRLRDTRRSVVWIEDMLPPAAVVQILSHARVFVCPSVYEPFGLVNVEAMACGAAVVATATGGIPEIVVDGETGLLVPLPSVDAALGPAREREPFARSLAARIDELLSDPDTARRLGRAGRQRVLQHFNWSTIAARTAALYRQLV